MSSANRTDPKLWETVRKEIANSGKGGEPGQWSARKAQMAVQEYKRRGGGYEDDGPRRQDTDLHHWTAEDWGTRSGEESGKTGERYLPRMVGMLLTGDEYRRSTRKKRKDTTGRGEQFSDQPKDVRDKVAHIKKHGPPKKMLHKRASELGIDGRSRMSAAELLQAIENATDEGGRAKGLDRLGKDELYERAQDAGIEGRSSMSKDDLVRALSRD